MEFTHFKLAERLTSKQIHQLHQLYQKEWWTDKRTLHETKAVVKGSQIVIGVLDINENLVGFCRVLTDYIFKALIFDVIVDDKYRGQGIGDKMIQAVKQHPKLISVKHFELYCLPEMVPFYQRHYFSEEVAGTQMMRYAKQ